MAVRYYTRAGKQTERGWLAMNITRRCFYCVFISVGENRRSLYGRWGGMRRYRYNFRSSSPGIGRCRVRTGRVRYFGD